PGLDHSTGDVASLRRHAPGGGAIAAAGANAAAGHGGAAHQHMTLAALAAWLADEPCQRVTRPFGRSCRTRLVRAAGAVHLASGDPREPDARSFGAPYRT